MSSISEIHETMHVYNRRKVKLHCNIRCVIYPSTYKAKQRKQSKKTQKINKLTEN
jgi:hypothetical protein